MAGLTAALTEVCKGALADTQERAGESRSRLQRRGAGAGQQARVNAEDLRSFVVTVPDQMKNLPGATRARIVDLQRQANELMVQAGNTYGPSWPGGASARSTTPWRRRGTYRGAERRTETSG